MQDKTRGHGLQRVYVDWFLEIQCGAVIARSIFSKILAKDTPYLVRYDVSFADQISDLYSSPVTALVHAISCYIGPRYNGTQLCYGLFSVVQIIFSKGMTLSR